MAKFELEQDYIVPGTYDTRRQRHAHIKIIGRWGRTPIGPPGLWWKSKGMKRGERAYIETKGNNEFVYIYWEGVRTCVWSTAPVRKWTPMPKSGRR